MKVGKPAPIPRPIARLTEGRPPIEAVLGEGGGVQVRAAARPGGRVLWFNWALAEELGLAIPPDRRMTADFEAEVLAALNLDVLGPADDGGGRPVKLGFADYYGGAGIGHNRGSGRAAFFGELNLSAKGIGAIDAMLSDATIYSHRHGGMSFLEGGQEAVWGETGHNLFTRGAARILAVLDRGDVILWGDGGERRAVAVRHGPQLRPAHLLTTASLEARTARLLRMLDASGDLVVRADGRADLGQSMERLIAAHARAAAEQFRHRVLHGALSQSNMELSAAMLDSGTITTEPRTAPIHVLDYGKSDERYRFAHERHRRVAALEEVYALMEEASAKRRSPFVFRPLSVRRRFQEQYRREMAVTLVSAIGFSRRAAEAVAADQPVAATRFAEVIAALAQEANPAASLSADKEVPEPISVADVFGALGTLPRAYFLARDSTRPAPLVDLLREHLHLVGGAELEQSRRVSALIRELAPLYAQLLEAGRRDHLARGGTSFGYERQAIERAAFENRPTPELYRARLRYRLIELTQAYERDGDAARFQRELDRVIAGSLRSVDGLARTGQTHHLADGTARLQERVLRGVRYAVVVPPAGPPRVEASLPVERLPDGRYRLPTLDLVRTGAELGALVYKHTLDGWRTSDLARGELRAGELVFTVPSYSSQAAALEGVFYATDGDFYVHDQGGNFEGYVFAAPDEVER